MYTNRISGKTPVMGSVPASTTIAQMQCQVTAAHHLTLAGYTDVEEFVPVAHANRNIPKDRFVYPNGVVREIQGQFVRRTIVGKERSDGFVGLFAAYDSHGALFGREHDRGVRTAVSEIDPGSAGDTITVFACGGVQTGFFTTGAKGSY